MKDFSTITNTTGSNWYDARAADASPPSLRNGTAIDQDLVNDIWGALQATLYAGYQHEGATDSPSGTVETYSSSDFLDALRRTCGHPGEIVYVGTEVPTGARLLILAGQVLEIADYPDLVAATYIGDGNNADTDYTGFYKTSDAGGTTRSTSGSYFVLPDCRGQFIRCLAGFTTGEDEGRDDDGTRLKYTSLQEQSHGEHIHQGLYANGGILEMTGYTMAAVFEGADFSISGNDLVKRSGSNNVAADTYLINVPTTSTVSPTSGSVTNTPGSYETGYLETPATNGPDEVRPKNIAFQAAIRY